MLLFRPRFPKTEQSYNCTLVSTAHMAGVSYAEVREKLYEFDPQFRFQPDSSGVFRMPAADRHLLYSTMRHFVPAIPFQEALLNNAPEPPYCSPGEEIQAGRYWMFINDGADCRHIFAVVDGTAFLFQRRTVPAWELCRVVAASGYYFERYYIQEQHADTRASD